MQYTAKNAGFNQTTVRFDNTIIATILRKGRGVYWVPGIGKYHRLTDAVRAVIKDDHSNRVPEVAGQ